MRDVIALRSGLLYAGRIRDNTSRFYGRPAPRHPILGPVMQPLTPVLLYDASSAGSSRPHRSPDWSVTRVWFAAAELLSAGFRPREVPPPDAGCVVLIPLSKYRF